MIIIVIFIVVLLVVFLYVWGQLRLSLRPLKFYKKSLEENQLKILKKTFATADGVNISSWYIPVKNAKAVLILTHGHNVSKENKTRMLAHAKYLNKNGYSTLLIDFRSFGQSQGSKTYLGIREWKDLEAAYDYLKILPENKYKKIGFYGKSMGAVTAIITKALTKKGDFIIAITPFAKYSDLFKFRLQKMEKYGFLLFPFLWFATLIELGLSYENFSPISLIKKISVPIFIIGAKYEDWIPKQDPKYLFEKANSPKEFCELPTNHSDIYRQNPEIFERKILSFLSKYVVK